MFPFFVEGGEFASPKLPKKHSTYRTAHLSTSTISDSSPLVSFKCIGRMLTLFMTHNYS